MQLICTNTVINWISVIFSLIHNLFLILLLYMVNFSKLEAYLKHLLGLSPSLCFYHHLSCHIIQMVTFHKIAKPKNKKSLICSVNFYLETFITKIAGCVTEYCASIILLYHIHNGPVLWFGWGLLLNSGNY